MVYEVVGQTLHCGRTLLGGSLGDELVSGEFLARTNHLLVLFAVVPTGLVGKSLGHLDGLVLEIDVDVLHCFFLSAVFAATASVATLIRFLRFCSSLFVI